MVDSICRQADEIKRSIKELEMQRRPELNFEKWEHFISKLNTKILELEADADRESKNCQQKHEEIALLDTIELRESPLCIEGQCPLRMPTSDIEMVRRDSLHRHDSPLDLVHHLAAVGARATAEYYTEQIADVNLKLLATAYLRIVYNDRKSAGILMKELFKTSLKSQVALFSALIAWSEHAYNKTQKFLAEINTSELSSWEKDYYNLMSVQH
jgi:hypothetical protein